MSNLLSKQQLLQAITVVLGLEDYDAGLTRLAEELTVGLNPWSKDSPEFTLPRGDWLWSASRLVAAGGAGFRSIFQIQVDSPGLMVLEGWQIGGGGAAYMMARTTPGTNLTTDDTNITHTERDTRSRTKPPFVHAREQNGVALPAGVSNGQFLGDVAINNTNVVDQIPIILTEGNGICWYPSADNVSIRVNCWGRVRRILNSRELVP